MSQSATARCAPPPPGIDALLALIEEGAILIDRGGRAGHANVLAAELLGCGIEGIRSQRLWSPPWEWRDANGRPLGEAGNPLATACREGGEAQGEFELRRDAKPGLRLHCRCRPVPSESAEWHLLTIRPASAEAGDGSEEACRALLDRLPVPLWTQAEHETQRHINHTWRETCGGTGHTQRWEDTVHPADLAALHRAYRAMREGRGSGPTQFRLRSADGTYHWYLEHIVHRPATPACPAGHLGLAVDIGLLQQHDDAIRTLSRALEQTDARIVITDPQGSIEYVNTACCEAYGYSREALIGQNPRLFKSGRTPDAVYRQLWSALAAGDTWRGELTNRTRDGRLLVETVTISPVRDEHGHARHFVAVKEDVTTARATARAQREADARLAQIERMRTVDALAGGIAHEFNNILVAILGYSDLGARVLAAGGDAARVAKYLVEIRSAGERARELVGRLRAFGRSGEHEPATVSLAPLLGDFAALMAVVLPKDQQLEVQVATDLPALDIDRGAIQQVLLNLCLNARDAMADGGTIRVCASRHLPTATGEARCDACHHPIAGDYVAITVEDEGPGIAADARGRLFEPFFSTKDPASASGLGLSVAHGIVHRHAGHILVGHEPGSGASISVLLPLETEAH
ncbi:MAG: PAS domain S-box protein [Rhodocyclaceae bacterium]|nr:PAS domain S-box protein [Rhodocyclaceae bacterium]